MLPGRKGDEGGATTLPRGYDPDGSLTCRPYNKGSVVAHKIDTAHRTTGFTATCRWVD